MTVKVGDTFTSNNFGRYRVGILDGDYAWIVFEDTGNVEHPAIRMIVANGIVDYKADYNLRVGHLYNTSNYGKVKVLQAIDSKNVKVKFVNTGYEMTTQKFSVMAGLLVDKAAKVIEAQTKAEEKHAKELERQAALASDKREREDLLAREKDELARKKLVQKEAEKEVRKVLGSDGNMFMNTFHMDKLGFRFQVVDRVELTTKWIVAYIESGNTYTVTESNIRRQQVYDTAHPNYFDLRALYLKEQAALYYEANREKIIKKNSEYQKRNLDKARVRNQNRRSKRVGGDGKHTLDEIEFIMELQDHKCASCGVALDDSNKHLDHILPLALGGSNEIKNLQWLCKFCNISKSASHPDDWEVYSKSEHFKARLEHRRLSLQ